MKKFTDFYLKEELQKRGLNPNNPEFLDDPRYNEIKNMKIISGKLGAITYDYYIRSNWFKDGITKLKRGRFDIGAKRDEAPINMAKLIDEICQEAIDNGEEDEAAYSTENIRRKLIGSPSGIRHNLKTKIAFDLNDYHNQEFEKLKLLKLLYSIEKRQKGKINITSLLSYLSLENVDKRIIGDQSVHGEIITELLSEIRLELDESFHKTVLDAIVKIAMMWNKKLLEVAKISKMPHHKDVRIYELIRIKQYLINLKNRLPEPQIVSESNIMEAFYLRVMQLQELCRTEDVNRITDFILNSTHTKEMLGKKQQRLNPEFMNQVITDLEPFIQQQAQKVTEAVYQKDNVTDSEISNIAKWSTHVPTLLNSYNKQVYAEERQNLTCFFLVSCLQEIMLSETLKKGDDEYEFKNNHYGSDRKGRGLHSNLKKMNKNILVEEALELIWVGKVERRMYANQDLLEEYLLIQEIGRLANEFIGIIAKLPDLETMFYWNDFLLSQIIVAEKAPILHYTANFNNIIREKTGYSCESHSARMFQYFDNINIANNITNIFLNEVAKDIQLSKSGYTRDKQIMNIKIEDEAFIVVYAFDRNPRRLIIHNFMPIMADDEIELGIKAGLEKFKKHDEFIDLMKRI